MHLILLKESRAERNESSRNGLNPSALFTYLEINFSK
nr:MAG TPA: hypothetical protein [Bacteriophage sp.]